MLVSFYGLLLINSSVRIQMFSKKNIFPVTTTERNLKKTLKLRKFFTSSNRKHQWLKTFVLYYCNLAVDYYAICEVWLFSFRLFSCSFNVYPAGWVCGQSDPVTQINQIRLRKPPSLPPSVRHFSVFQSPPLSEPHGIFGVLHKSIDTPENFSRSLIHFFWILCHRPNTN